MNEHVFEKSWSFEANQCKKIWDKLQRRETFVKGQLPPYKVEFASGRTSGVMESGELNIHHGPFLSVQGPIGEITDHYRDLHYLYGSYVLSFRLIRPKRLEFFREDTEILVRLTSEVSPRIKSLWNFSLHIFWSFFKFLI